MLESEIGDLIRLEAPKYKVTLFRNNTGVLFDKTGRPVRYGLANESAKQNEIIKSSDYIGFTELIITPEMVGQTIAVFTAIETKEPKWKWKGDKREMAQKNFTDFVTLKGGFAGFANSIESFLKIVRKL